MFRTLAGTLLLFAPTYVYDIARPREAVAPLVDQVVAPNKTGHLP